MRKIILLLVLLTFAPQIFAQSTATAKGQSSLIYTCPMHPEVQSDKPGNCPKCGMRLEKKVPQKVQPKTCS